MMKWIILGALGHILVAYLIIRVVLLKPKVRCSWCHRYLGRRDPPKGAVVCKDCFQEWIQ